MINAIETRQIGYRAGPHFEISGVDLNVPEGGIYGFLGPNGAGKTTTIRLLLGLLRPRRGSITVLGQSVPEHASEVLGRIGYVPEQPHFDNTLTVREVLRFQAAFYRGWDWLAAEQMLLRLELDERQLFGRLSKGQKAKLLMLSALAQRPDLLVLDEPTDGLDPVARREIITSLLEYVSERQATVLISSHLVHELERICSWVSVMDRGRLIVELPMERFRSGIKRLRVSAAPTVTPADLPFVILAREGAGTVEHWVVRGWEPGMEGYFSKAGAELREVLDLDLEDGYVELLKTFRAGH
jgi:ABC-type multidrug transport system ATPase subunit